MGLHDRDWQIEQSSGFYESSPQHKDSFSESEEDYWKESYPPSHPHSSDLLGDSSRKVHGKYDHSVLTLSKHEEYGRNSTHHRKGSSPNRSKNLYYPAVPGSQESKPQSRYLPPDCVFSRNSDGRSTQRSDYLVESDEFYYGKNTSVRVYHTSEQQDSHSLKGPTCRDDGKVYLSESDDIYKMKVNGSQQRIR